MKTLLLFSTLFAFNIVFSQTTENTVTLTTSGTGKTLEEAKNNALRSAIEQAFGAFVSSKTEILNDQLVSDQITSVSSGNIQKFEIKSESKLPNDIWCTTLTATVSVDKLISFVQAKGVTVEIKGGLFALNVKQQILNENGEVNAILNLFELVYNNFGNCFNFELFAGRPVSLSNSNQNWEIPLKLRSLTNENISEYNKLFSDYLRALSLTQEELETYKSLNKETFKVKISSEGKVEEFYLRSSRSFDLLVWLGYFMESFQNNFIVYNDLGNLNSEYRWDIEQKIDFFGAFYPAVEFYFPSSGAVLRESSVKDIISLSNMEKITGYHVKSLDLENRFENGGISIKKPEGGIIVFPLIYLENLNWNEANQEVKKLSIQGYNNFELPSKSDFEILSRVLNIKCDWRRGNNYWTSDQGSGECATNQVLIVNECGDEFSCLDKNESLKKIIFIRRI